MATPRFNSDRFFTSDYRPQAYTKAGLNLLDHNTMVTVLGRNYPQLRDAMKSVDNGFHPWARAGAG